MAQDGKILKSDVSEKDPFQFITDSAKLATAQVENLKKDLELILPATQKLLESKSTTVEAINKQAKAMEVLSNRQKEARKAEEDATRAEKAHAQARVSQIKLDQAREKSIDQYNKKLEVSERQAIRNAKAEARLSSAYFKVQDGLSSLANRYRELAIKKEMGETLSAKEEVRLGRLQVLTLKYDAALKKVDADMGRHQRNVGNYKSGFDGLGHSINQLTREAPAFAVSMNTGFLALSNNIPMLFDELSRVKKVNAEIIAQGGQTKSMWAQLGKSVFSFQTLLSLGVTLLTIYGGKLVETISNFVKGSAAIDAYKKTKEALNDSTKEGIKSAQDELTQLRINLGVAKDVKKSYEDRLASVKTLQSTYPAFLGNMSKEQILAGDTATAERELTKAILQRAKAQAATAKITDNQTKIIDLEEERRLLNFTISYQEKLAKAAQDRAFELAKTGKESDYALQRNINAQSELNSSLSERARIDNELNALGKVNNRLTQYAIDNTRTLGVETKTTTKARAEHIEQLKREKYAFSELTIEITKYQGIQSPEKLAKILALEDERAKRIANIAVIEAEIALNKARMLQDTNLITQAEIELYKVKKAQIELERDIEVKNTTGDPAKTEELEKQADLDIQKLQVTDEQTKAIEEQDKAVKKLGEASQESLKIATDYYDQVLQNRIDYYDTALDSIKSNIDYLEAKAANGNLQAEESLKAQLRLQKEINDEKLAAQNKQAKLALIGNIASGIGGIAGSIQGFETGTEGNLENYVKPNLTNVGKDNMLVRVHGKERIINEGLSNAITGHKTSEVIANHQSYLKVKNGQVGYSIDNSETNRLLKEIASKSVPNWELGEIGQGFMDVVKREVNGNKETVHIYRNKYR